MLILNWANESLMTPIHLRLVAHDLKLFKSHYFPYISTYFTNIYIALTKKILYYESGEGFNAIEGRNIEKFDTNENPSIFTHHN